MKTMSREELRRHIAELVIVLCLCGGGYYFFVKPAETSLSQTRAQIVEAQREAARASAEQLNWSKTRATLDHAMRLAVDVDARSLSARDQAVMFTTLSRVAADCGVLVDAIQPSRQASKTRPPAAGSPSAAAGAPTPPVTPDDLITSYTVELRGGYTNIIRMLATLENDNAYTVVQRVQVQTIADPNRSLVRAVIRLDRFAFDTAPLRTAIAGAAPDAQPEGTP